MEHDDTATGNGSPNVGDSGPITEPLQIWVADGEREVMMPGQRTVCPYLVVVPILTGGSYTGAFSLAHVLTETVLHTAEEDHLTPELARYAAAQLACLDWSSEDPQTYQGLASTNRYAAAWLNALSAAQDLRWSHGVLGIPEAVEAAEAAIRMTTGKCPMNTDPGADPCADVQIGGPSDGRVTGPTASPGHKVFEAGLARAELDAAIATLSAAHREMVGPRRPGMICRGGWGGGLTYRVDAVQIDSVQLGPDGHPPSVRVLLVETDLEGPSAGRRRAHCTRWNDDRDRVLADPYTVAVGHPVPDTQDPAGRYGARQQVRAAARPGDGAASWINDTATLAHTPGGPTTVRVGPEAGGVVEVSTSIEGGQVQIAVVCTGGGRPDGGAVPIRITLNATEIVNQPATE